jgi:hypothetical protein
MTYFASGLKRLARFVGFDWVDLLIGAIWVAATAIITEEKNAKHQDHSNKRGYLYRHFTYNWDLGGFFYKT